MEPEKAAEALSNELEERLRTKMGPLLARYDLSVETLVKPLRWRPLVLVIGNYSSGKSTFINELLEEEVQRTGQAPTDDSFTILTAPGAEEPKGDVPGSTVVNDERLPFEKLRRFGESLIAHVRLKRVDAPVLKDLAIIDTPGMLDSVTEKDRGYDYLGVVGELARLADLIILMFDPHKAGTIKETYEAIRSTLPGTAGEDRLVYVLNRIDECENVTDLVRAYGTLCWNLSQMTGRKDMPRVFLTFAPRAGHVPIGFEVWLSEREELKQAVCKAPRLRLNHILQDVDRVLRELALQVEALVAFRKRFGQRLRSVVRIGGFTALIAFLFFDVLLELLTGFPPVPLLNAVLNGTLGVQHFLWPVVGSLSVVAVSSLYVQRLLFPRFVRQIAERLDTLVSLDTTYRRDLWQRVAPRVKHLITQQARRQIWMPHRRNLSRIQTFLEKDLARFYERVRTG